MTSSPVNADCKSRATRATSRHTVLTGHTPQGIRAIDTLFTGELTARYKDLCLAMSMVVSTFPSYINALSIISTSSTASSICIAHKHKLYLYGRPTNTSYIYKLSFLDTFCELKLLQTVCENLRANNSRYNNYVLIFYVTGEGNSRGL